MQKKNLVLIGVLVFVLSLVGVYVFAQGTVFHPASDIMPGTFGGTGNYSFLGNVGIGTTSPQNKLHVDGRVRAGSFLDKDNAAYFVDPSGYTSNNITYSAILNGIVGIGTTDPQNKLHVDGWVRAGSFLDKDNAAYFVDPSGYTSNNITYSAILNGRVGIGKVPDVQLEVKGEITSHGAIKSNGSNSYVVLVNKVLNKCHPDCTKDLCDEGKWFKDVCIAACSRYCEGSDKCKGTKLGGYSGGTLTEYDKDSGSAKCVCIP